MNNTNYRQIIDLIKNHFNNNDYLMIKASNATGFNKIVNNLKDLKYMLYQFLLNFVDTFTSFKKVIISNRFKFYISNI